jgi:hypothetical protein
MEELCACFGEIISEELIHSIFLQCDKDVDKATMVLCVSARIPLITHISKEMVGQQSPQKPKPPVASNYIEILDSPEAKPLKRKALQSGMCNIFFSGDTL